MKILLLCMFVSIALASRDSKVSQEELARSLARAFRIDPMESLECVRKSEVTIEDLRYMEDAIDFDDTETTDMKSLKRASCVVVCCAQKMGIMRGKEILVEELFRFFQKTGMPEEMEMPMRTSVHICKEQVTDTSDECMAGYKFMKCMYKRTSSMEQHR